MFLSTTEILLKLIESTPFLSIQPQFYLFAFYCFQTLCRNHLKILKILKRLIDLTDCSIMKNWSNQCLELYVNECTNKVMMQTLMWSVKLNLQNKLINIVEHLSIRMSFKKKSLSWEIPATIDMFFCNVIIMCDLSWFFISAVPSTELNQIS